MVDLAGTSKFIPNKSSFITIFYRRFSEPLKAGHPYLILEEPRAFTYPLFQKPATSLYCKMEKSIFSDGLL